MIHCSDEIMNGSGGVGAMLVVVQGGSGCVEMTKSG